MCFKPERGGGVVPRGAGPVQCERDGLCRVSSDAGVGQVHGRGRRGVDHRFGDVRAGEDGAGVERAQAICNRCPVSERCLQYALEFRIEHGVWGGASERERRRILRQNFKQERAQVILNLL